jgi:hypothetical protein
MNIPQADISYRHNKFQYLLAVLVGLVLADGYLTQFLVDSGLGREANPFLGNIIDNGNLIALKLVGALISSLILWDIHRRHPRLASVSTLLCVVAYTGIVCWNIYSLIISQGGI